MEMKCGISVVLVIAAILHTGCEKEYGDWDQMDRYTSKNCLSDSMGIRIDQVVFEYINDYRYISLGLLGPEGIVFVRCYGDDRRGKVDEYASVSKPVTSMIFFQMLEAGLIASVDDPISDYSEQYRNVMPDKYLDKPVTFRHLLSHRSGIPHHDRIWDQGKLDLQFEPGSAMLYSTRGYGVLGEVLSEISGSNYNELVQEYIGQPVNAGSFSASSLLFEAPGGLVKSEIDDMALFAEGILDHRYVNDSLKYNLQWVPQGSDQAGEMGLGWYIYNYGDKNMAVYHAGSNGTPRAFISLRPRQHLGVVLLGKHQTSDGSQMFIELARDLVILLEAM